MIYLLILFSATCYICKHEHHPSVILVDCDHTVQQKKWKLAQDRIGYLHAEADLDCSIL